MATGGQDFQLKAGTEKKLIFIVSDVTDISGADNIAWGMSRDPKSAAILEKTDGGGGITVENQNEIHVTLERGDTDDLVRGRYYHAVGVIDGTGRAFPDIGYGWITLEASLWNKIWDFFNP